MNDANFMNDNIEQTYSYDDVEAALCIWEEIILRISMDDAYKAEREMGMATLRAAAIDLGPAFEKAWQTLDGVNTYDDCFDWEFVPALLAKLDSPYMDEATRDAEVLEAAKVVIKEHAETEAKRVSEFNAKLALRELENGWGKNMPESDSVYGYDTTRPDCPACGCTVGLPADADPEKPWTAKCRNGHEYTYELFDADELEAEREAFDKSVINP